MDPFTAGTLGEGIPAWMFVCTSWNVCACQLRLITVTHLHGMVQLIVFPELLCDQVTQARGAQIKEPDQETILNTFSFAGSS